MAPRITLAGQVGIEAGPRRTDAGGLGRLGRLALAYLVCERHRPVPRGELADVLWGDELPRSWETSLRVVVSRLRSWLSSAGVSGSDVLTTAFGCYQVHLPAGWVVDVEEAAADLERAATAQAGGDPAAARSLAEAAAVVAGADFVPGGSGAWIERRQDELRELRVRALEAVADAALASGDAAGALVAAEDVLAVDPLRESAYVRVMAAHAEAGNRGAALRAYQRCRVLLAEELGVAPSSATETAYLSLLGDERQGAEQPAATAAAAAPAGAPGPLFPVPASTFVGRAREVAEVLDLVRTRRLVTLTGTGGLGKTRLALEVAAAAGPEFGSGAAVVALGDVDDPAAVPGQFLTGLRMAEEPGRSPADSVAVALVHQHLLLVVDNCEHVIAGAAAMVDRLVRACPRLTVLATSREALGVPGEVAWAVPGLDEPDGIRLFAERARAARRDFDLDPGTEEAVAAICRRLDGIPLAIELAGARVPVLSPGEIAHRLDDRFRLLTGGARTAPLRHQTLRAALDWSHDGLSPVEQRLFREVSVFAGSFTLAAAEQVSGPADGREPAGDVGGSATLDVLAALAARSLVMADLDAVLPTRYRLLETIRAYALERLEASGEAGMVRGRLQAWAARLAESADAHLDGPEGAEWLERIAVDHPNLLGAVWGDPTSHDALRLVTSLARFWEMRGHLEEGRRALRAVLSESGSGAPVLRARAHNAAGVLAQRQGDYAAARSRYETSLAIRRAEADRLGSAMALHGLGNVAALEGDMAQARQLYQESLNIGRDEGEPSLVAATLTNLGWVAHTTGEFSRARAYYEEALALRRQQGDGHGIALVLGHLGDLAYQQGDYDRSSALHFESLGLRRALGDRAGCADCLATLGHLALQQGDLPTARAHLEQSLTLRRELNDRASLPSALSNLADLALATNELSAARSLLEEAEAVATAGRDHPALAHVLLHQARLARAEGRLPEAFKCYAQARDLAGETIPAGFTAEWLEGVGATVAAAGDALAGARLLAAADALRQNLGLSVPPSEREGRRREHEAVRTALGAAAFGQAWQQGLALPLDEALEEAGRALG